MEETWTKLTYYREIEDCNDAWTFRPDSFDFIHMRFMLGSITDWQATFKEAFTACTPGGWVESYEVSSTMESDDDSIPDGSAMQRWGQVFEEGGQRAGRSFAMIKEDVQKSSLEAAGFINIHVEDLKVRHLIKSSAKMRSTDHNRRLLEAGTQNQGLDKSDSICKQPWRGTMRATCFFWPVRSWVGQRIR
jgi:hypothetical protein